MEFEKKTPEEKARTFQLLQKLYAAEPIRPKDRPRTQPLPEPLARLRAMQQDETSSYETTAQLFVRQGRALEDYEDDAVYDLPVLHYYPTYRVLTDPELRGYFGWRTRLRHHDLERTSLTYAFLYIYELLNQIGVKDPMEGYRKLCAFHQEYRLLDARIDPYLHQWLRDYVLYYQLDPGLLPRSKRMEQDRALLTLQDWQQADDQAIFDALDLFSTYRLTRSRLYKVDPERTVHLFSRIYRGLQVYYARHRKKKTFLDEFLGHPTYDWLDLFANAVFLKLPDRRQFTVEETPLCIYKDDEGNWTLRRFNYEAKCLKKLGKLMKSLDGLLREALHVAPAVQQPFSYVWLTKLVGDVVAADNRERKEREARRVVFHPEALDRIRREAAVTRERLMTEEERREEALPAESLPGEPRTASPGQGKTEPLETEPLEGAPDVPGWAPAAPETAPAPSAPAAGKNPWNLTEDELHYLRDLLTGGDTSWVAARGLMPSLLVDGINEKCYGEFGDTVLEAGDPPSVIEDYKEDLKGQLEP
ncbi:TerB N-terminal domain-containing protein [Acidaminococcus timonensis]|uniref:TerB N-terminal domain-containing protein n=2 Tax=Acidaminococcus timonensis TaxID=1871002 RepID=UPI0008D9BBEC|nr:TerB N-terminal domain-containing protein [Acidaminococcus timonensis]